MTSKFFRFLSRRGSKSVGRPNIDNSSAHTKSSPRLTSHMTALNIFGPDSNINTNSSPHVFAGKHIKLKDSSEELKETIEHYNHRCQARRQLNEKENLFNADEAKIINKINDLSIKSTRNSKFFSFKSKTKMGKETTVSNGIQVPKDSVECSIIFLDQSQESFFVPKKALASKLYEKVFYHLDLIEIDYFGLQFSDTHGVLHWLDPTKPVRKQCNIGPPFQFFFKVKFYTAEPNNLKEELTRYFYFLQLRNDLRTGRLPCLNEQTAVELCAIILQEELGDFDQDQHTIETVSEFRLLPESQQTEQFEELVFNKYSNSTSYKAMSPAESELTFLNKVKWLEMYGVDMHSVYGRDNNEYKLGLTPSGILVFEEAVSVSGDPSQGVINNKIGLFYWPKIETITFLKKKFTILVSEDDNSGHKQQHTFIFNTIDEKACKHLWKCAVEFHSFFRLKTSLIDEFSASHGGIFSGFIRRGSRFRGPERTEFQTHNLSRMTMPRRSVQFERKPSQRFSRRASYAIKRKLQEQQKRGLSCQLNTSDILRSEKQLVSNSHTQPQTVSLTSKPPGVSLKSKSIANNLIPSSSDTKLYLSNGNQKSLSFANKAKPQDESKYDVINLYGNKDPKCNISKAQLMTLERKHLANIQTSFENKQLRSNQNKSSENSIRNNYSKIIENKSIFQSFEDSKKQIIVKKEVSDSEKVKYYQNQPIESYTSVPGIKNSPLSVKQAMFSNLDANFNNLQDEKSLKANNQQKPDINHISKNRNLISFNNNVSIMKINQQHMTEI